MTSRLNGRIALVTGAATGIGRATAERLAREGATVVAGVADEGQRIEIASASAFDVLALDVRSDLHWDRAMTHVETTHGGLDILVNNAGIHRSGTALETPREVWDEVMAVNLWGTFLGCKWAVEAMRRGGERVAGRIHHHPQWPLWPRASERQGSAPEADARGRSGRDPGVAGGAHGHAQPHPAL